MHFIIVLHTQYIYSRYITQYYIHFSHAVPKRALMLEHRLQYEHQHILSQVFKNHAPLSINTVFAFEGCPSVCSPFWMWQKTHPKTTLPHKSDRNILLFPTQHIKCSADSLAFISLASDDITESRAWDCFPLSGLFSKHHQHCLKAARRRCAIKHTAL